MNKRRIMLVEDEKVVAADIQECVKGLGYEVVGAAATGTEALRLAVKTIPDLVLMDIKLKGVLDGIDVAGALYDQLKIPVVYLTAHADAEILERAKQTAPSGYVLKPFDDRTLRTAIELAFDRHRRERQLIDGGQRLAAAIGSIDEAVIVKQESGQVALMNRVAEALTGWKQEEALAKPVDEVFTILNVRTGAPQASPIGRVFREGVAIGLGGDVLLLGRHGGRQLIQGSATPGRGGEGRAGGGGPGRRRPGRPPAHQGRRPAGAGWRSARRGRMSVVPRREPTRRRRALGGAGSRFREPSGDPRPPDRRRRPKIHSPAGSRPRTHPRRAPGQPSARIWPAPARPPCLPGSQRDDLRSGRFAAMRARRRHRAATDVGAGRRRRQGRSRPHRVDLDATGPLRPRRCLLRPVLDRDFHSVERGYRRRLRHRHRDPAGGRPRSACSRRNRPPLSRRNPSLRRRRSRQNLPPLRHRQVTNGGHARISASPRLRVAVSALAY